MDKNNKLLWVVVGLSVLMGLFIVGSLVVDKVADRVIEKLQKNYAPGPYAPGFDPDKVNPTLFRQLPAPPPGMYGSGGSSSWDADFEAQRQRY